MYKLEVYVIDFEDCGIEEQIHQIENYLEVGLAQVKASATADIGEWSNSHILNFTNTPVEKFREYFND